MNSSKKVKKQAKSPPKITDIFKKLQEKNGLKSRKPDELHEISSKRKCLSLSAAAAQRSPLKRINSPEKPSTSTARKSPQKLFQKTPKKVENFCVETIEKFVRVTPSKSNSVSPNISPTKSGKFMITQEDCSLSTSKRSVQAQKHNERTPVKENSKVLSASPIQSSKVKTRLNFSESSKENKAMETFISEEEIADMLSDYTVDDTDFSTVENKNEVEQISTLDLRKTQRCEILKIEGSPIEIVIHVKSTIDGELGVCSLKDFWCNTKLEVGDLISLTAKKMNNKWVVDNTHGCVIYEPDLLIPTTSVANSIFCPRRKILEQKYRGFFQGNECMLFGSVVHGVLQETLKKQLRTRAEIEEIFNSILSSKEMVKRLYETGTSLENFREKMNNFYLPRIVEFIKNYIPSQNSSNNTAYNWNNENWKGKIHEIQDIEESVWCPSLGVKGNIDVTVKTDDKTIKPLELKTGNPSFSIEHKGQVVLYVMMMKKLGFKVNSGLILYLRDGIIRELAPTENEQRDIILLRNEHAYYLKRKPIVQHDEELDEKIIIPAELPPPIDHAKCDQCPYNAVCTTYLRYEKTNLKNFEILENSVKEQSHLSEEHLNYFVKWSSLITLEENVEFREKKPEDIYTIPPPAREILGRCICNLRICSTSKEYNGHFDHTFEKSKEETGYYNFFSAGFDEGNYVVISIDKRPAICTGFITNIGAHSVTVSIDRNLRKKYPFDNFHIDFYVSTFTFTFYQSSLALLLESSKRSEQMRSLIVEKTAPKFHEKLPKIIATVGKSMIKKLNRKQRAVVLKSISARDYLLIHGMPGTGKTTTMAVLVQLLVETGKSVLITSHTHSAVDNICIKLAQNGVDFLRLGSAYRVHESLKEYSESHKTEHCKTPEELSKVYSEAKIIATTCLATGHALFSNRTLDVCIVDESTQILQPILFNPIHKCKSFILIGDPEQLPPIVRNPEARQMGMSESLFDRLKTPQNTISLNLNYRMNRTITELANRMTYNGELLVANEATGCATLKYTNAKEFVNVYSERRWIIKALDAGIENSVKIIDIGAAWKLENKVSWSVRNENNSNQINVHEAAVIFNLIKAFKLSGIELEKIGVIATYIWQVKQLSSIIDRRVLVTSVDQFQGKDKDIIIYSCTKSTENWKEGSDKRFHIMEDKRRLNVAITRAKKKLIIVGDVQTVINYKPFKRLLECVDAKHVIKLDDIPGFEWNQVLREVEF